MMTRVDLDYSPLSAPLDSKQQQVVRPAALKNVTPGMVALGGSVLIIFFLMLTARDGFTLGVLLIPMLILATITYLFYSQRLRIETETVRLQRLAEVNGLTIHRQVFDPNYAGMMFGLGKKRELIHSIELPISDQQTAEVGRYKYVIQQGKNTRTEEIGFIRMKLPRRLPHMVLDAVQNNYIGRFLSNLPQVFDSSQTLSLEGDFDKHFTLYAPKQYERDALYVFTPDVMSALIDSSRAYDIEIVEDELYVYAVTPFNLTDETEVRKLLKLSRTVQPELDQQTDYYSDERVGDRQANMIAPAGKRLRKGVNWLVLIGSLVYFLFFFGQFWTVFNGNPILLPVMLFLLFTSMTLVIGWATYSVYRKK